MLEGGGWNRRDLTPVFDVADADAALFAEAAIRFIVKRLKLEQLECESIEFLSINFAAQRSRHEVEAKGFGKFKKISVHAVFVLGWCSATTGQKHPRSRANAQIGGGFAQQIGLIRHRGKYGFLDGKYPAKGIVENSSEMRKVG